MLLPGALLDTPLFLRALGPSLSALLPIVLIVLLTGPLVVLVLAWLFLCTLLVLILTWPALLLLPIVLIVLLPGPLVILVLAWLLVLVLMWLLLPGMVGLLLVLLLPLLLRFLVALLLLLCISRRSDGEKQRQNGGAGYSIYFHTATSVASVYLSFFLTKASGCVDLIADGLAGYEKLNSPVLLTACGVIVGGYWHSVTKACCAH